MLMNPEVKAKWVAALRSGKYGQYQGQLQSRDGKNFCCLGVLCDISGIGDWVDHSYNDDGLPSEPVYEAGGSEAYDFPVAAVLDWAGFDSKPSSDMRIPKVVIGGESYQLHDHNDAGKTFDEIADAIEGQL